MKTFEEKRKKMAQKELKWAQEKELIERNKKIKTERKEMTTKKTSTSKLLVWFLFLNCTIIEIFTGLMTVWEMCICSQTYQVPNFTPLITLIGAVVGETIGFAIYSIKSAKENCKNGIVYETAMHNLYTDIPHYEEDNETGFISGETKGE